MPNKIKKVFKNKDEVIADLKKNAEFTQRMKFVKETFYPALCEASMNIEDAGMLLAGFNDMIMQEFLGRMKEVKMIDLKLENKLDKTSPKYEQNKKMLALFDGCNVFEAKQYVEGMRGEIETFKRDEMQDRPLSSLKTKWVDQL